MSIVLTLVNNDLLAVRSWFSTQLLSKLLVLVGFVAVLGAVAVSLFYGARWTFMILAPLGEYGRLTADYIVRAAILFIFWLGLGSGMAATANTFSSRNRNFDYLLSLPVKATDLAGWYFTKTILTNAVLQFIFIFPLTLAFGREFWGGISLIFLARAGLVILALAAITNSVGGMVVWLMIKHIHQRTLLTGTGLVAGFLLVMVLLFRAVFPADLMQMTLAAPEEFLKIYNRLPLTNRFLPTNWIAGVLTGKSADSLWATGILTLVIMILCFVWLKNNFLNIFQKISQSAMAPRFTATGKVGINTEIHFDRMSPNIALAEKDLVSIIRSPAEAGYGLFLLLLVISFFGLFSRIKLDPGMGTEWINRLVIFTYLGFVFFANTYCLRLVFPLMAKEAESAWYLFSLPVSRIKIWGQKLVLAVAVSYPLIFLAMTVWWILPFAYPHQLVLTAASLWLVLLLPVLHASMGSIFPNFAVGNDPEKVSTSSMGILTLIISSGVALVFALSLYRYITGAMTLLSVAGIYLFVSTLSTYIPGRISANFLNKFEF